jgi:hypothetical protein
LKRKEFLRFRIPKEATAAVVASEIAEVASEGNEEEAPEEG